MFRYTIVSLLMLASMPVAAQQAEQGEARRVDDGQGVVRRVDDNTISSVDTVKVFHGVALKIDVGGPVVAALAGQGTKQSYEAQVSVNLRNKYFPLLEAGFATCRQTVANGGHYDGQGGFSRVGLDISLMKNSTPATWRNYMLAGIRLGGAVQGYEVDGLSLHDAYWNESQTVSMDRKTRFDMWGEVTLGSHVEVIPRLILGWNVRMKLLMTRGRSRTVVPWYVPGYGRRENSNFGFNYYVGYRF